MNPEHVTARNFRSWHRLDLDLPSGCTAISGVNGAGKSSILLAIELALFAGKGELARHFSRDPDGDVVEVGVVFEHAGRRFRVRRAWSERARKGTLTFDEVLPGEDTHYEAPGEVVTIRPGYLTLTRETVAETQALIERTLGLDRRTYRASAYIAQGDGAAFTAAQPRDRKDILADILGLDVWDRLAELAKADRQRWTAEVDTLRGKLQQMDEQLTEMPGVIDQLRMAREGLAEDEALIADLRSEVAQAGEQLEAARVAERMVEVRQTAFDVARRATDDANRQHERLRTQIREAREQDVSPADRSLADRLPALEAEQMGVWEAQKAWRERDAERQKALLAKASEGQRVESAQAELARLRAMHDGLVAEVADIGQATLCPMCGQEFGAELRAAAVERMTEKLDAAKRLADHAATATRELEAAWERMVVPDAEPEPQPRAELLDLIKQCQKVAERAARADERLAMAARWEVEANEVNQRVAELTAAQIEAEVALSRVQNAHDPTVMARTVRLVEQAESALQIAEQRYAQEGKNVAVLSEQERRLAELAQQRDVAASDAYDAHEQAAAARLLERAYGRNGVPALIMEQSAIPQIEQTANRVLADLGTDFTTQLRTQRILRSGDTADALDVVVDTPDGEALYEDLSGGERTRVDVALRLGLAELLAHRSGAEVRLLAMDEPAHLDDEGMMRLAAILERLSRTFDRILLVSHVPALADAFDQRIVVTRDTSGMSSLGVATELVAS